MELVKSRRTMDTGVQEIDYSDITVILKHFMRDGYVYECVKSIRSHFPNIKIFVSDDGPDSELRREFYEKNVDYYEFLPFDSGLPAGRNSLLQKVKTPFFLIGDDDFFYDERSDISKLRKLMDISDIAGGVIRENEIDKHYEGVFEREGNRYLKWKKLVPSIPFDEYEGVRYKRCDFTFNFFIAKTSIFNAVRWDEHIKISYEHSDFFLSAFEAGLQVVYCPDVFVTHKPKHVSVPDSGAYMNFRRRKNDRQYFLKKWGFETYIDINGFHDQLMRNDYQVNATECLRDAIHVLNEMRIKWWCEAGTCLGVMRSGDFVPHDTDIDIGVTDNTRIEELREGLLKAGFEFVHEFGTPDNGFEFAFRKHDVKIDFFWFYDSDGKLWHSAWKGETQLFYDFDPTLFINLKEVPFQGMNVWVPNPPEEYLEARYGDWHTVREEWDWAEDPLCRRR